MGKELFIAYAPFAVVDLPFSAVLDTIFLPIDGTRMILYRKTKSAGETSDRQPGGGGYGSPAAGSPSPHR